MDRQASQEGRAIRHHLSILAAPGLTAWAAHDMATGACTALRELGPSEHWEETGLPDAIGSVTFVTLPEWGTLVPDAAMADGSEAAHVRLVHGSMPSGAMRDEPLPTLSAHCVYVHDDRAEHQLLERFPSGRPLPLQALMVRTAITKGASGAALVLHRSEGRCDVALAADGRLLLSNSYPAPTATDVLYFTLLAVDRSALSVGDVRLLHGGTHLSDKDLELLRRYFPDESPVLEERSPVDGIFAPPSPSRWFALLEQFTCAS
jgi:hypothetical protein